MRHFASCSEYLFSASCRSSLVGAYETCPWRPRSPLSSTLSADTGYSFSRIAFSGQVTKDDFRRNDKDRKSECDPGV